MMYEYIPRYTWTPEEIAQVRETYGEADTPEALELWGADDWEEWHHIVPKGELTEALFEGRDRLRIKRARLRAGAEMGFGVGEAAIMGVRAMMAEHE